MAKPAERLRLLERRYVRRLLTLPGTALAAVLGVITLPFTLLAAAIVDQGSPWQRIRLVLLVVGGTVIETIGIVGSFVAWVSTGFGLIKPRAWSWPVHRRLMGRYTSGLLGWITRVLGARVEWRLDDMPASGPVIMLARHTSFFDALIPATVASRHRNLISHHVITAGLAYFPCIDLVGHRLPTHFLRRGNRSGPAELNDIERIGTQLDERAAAIIFPEGTFRDPDRFARAIARLRERSPAVAERAAGLRHTLPPRPQGTLALLRGAPDAQVVVCANTGLESFSTLAEIQGSLAADRPIVVETWTIDRTEVPEDPEAFFDWLIGIYEDIDEWVDATMPPAEADGTVVRGRCEQIR